MTRRIEVDKKRLIDKLCKMPIVEVACKQLNIPRSTYYRWKNNDHAFAKQCDEAIALSTDTINDLAESQLISAIKDKNLAAITFWLKHRNPSYSTKVVATGSFNIINETLTPEQEKIVNQALLMAGLTTEEESNYDNK